MQLLSAQKPVYEQKQEKNASWEIKFGNQAKKDLEKLKSISSGSTLKKKLQELKKILEQDPYKPKYEKLRQKGNIFSRKMNGKDRLVYEIRNHEMVVNILQILGHYND